MKDNDLISRQSLLNSLNRFAPEHFDALMLINDLIMKEPAVSFPQAHENDHIADGGKMDCISRIAVYDRVDRIVNVNHLDPGKVWFTPIGVKALIEELPSAQPEVLACGSGELVAQPEQRWIPVAERLPENRVYVLVTYRYEYGLIDHGITWYGGSEKKWNTSRDVIAWMPLPDPWKEGDDG